MMACAYVGSMCMPPLFGLIAQHVSVNLFPFYLVVFLALMVAMHELRAASAATVRPPDDAICETLECVSRAVCSNEPTTVDDELSAGCG